MTHDMKAPGVISAWGYVLRSLPERHKNSNNQFRSQFLKRYEVGPDLPATLHREQREAESD